MKKDGWKVVERVEGKKLGIPRFSVISDTAILVCTKSRRNAVKGPAGLGQV
jgi:hypothetical protein